MTDQQPEVSPRERALAEALRETLRALEAHLDESCRDHSLKHRDDLCPCNQNEVTRARAALAAYDGAEKGGAE